MTIGEMRKEIEAAGWEFHLYDFSDSIRKEFSVYLYRPIDSKMHLGGKRGTTELAATTAAYEWVMGKEKG